MASQTLREAHRRGRRLVSICTGAFALATAGLLDGRRATTHWQNTDELAPDFPLVKVDPDALYVDEGDVLTSAGVSCGIDLCLHIVRRDLGAHAANTVARAIVAAPHREGSQAQYIPAPVGRHETSSLAPTREWALEHCHEPLTAAGSAPHPPPTGVPSPNAPQRPSSHHPSTRRSATQVRTTGALRLPPRAVMSSAVVLTPTSSTFPIQKGDCSSCLGVSRPRLRPVPEGDPATGEVVRAELHEHPVIRQDLDVILPYLAADVCEHLVPVRELHSEGGVAQAFDDGALDFDAPPAVLGILSLFSAR
jgi:DJ-1/PfpI family